jgi:hypothetical protein
MTINDLKYQIFTQIARIQNEEMLQRVKDMLENISNENDLLYRAVKPLREKITVEELIQEQNYKGFDRVAFDKLVAELNIQDPIEDLLSLSTP